MDLKGLARGYLEAERYDVAEQSRDLLVGSRKGLGEDNEFIYVWVPTVGDRQSFRSREGFMLSQFKDINDLYPTAQKFMLVPNLEGLSTDFRSGARRWYNVKIRSTVQFFDTSFKWDDSPEATSVAKDVRDRGSSLLSQRVKQPFDSPTSEAGNDLLETLLTRLRQSADLPSRPIHLVIGPAGIGKTFLFESLFSRLYDEFQVDKRRQQKARRPMPLMPEYLRLSDAPTVKALLRAYLDTDFSRPLDEAVFRWMLANGFGVWLLDGLDEVIAQDSTFFDYLLDLMTMPGSAPPILICVRDSLLATSPELREFRDEYAGYIHTYELAPWGLGSRREYAISRLGASAEQFLESVRETGMDELASIPYYSSLLIEEFEATALDKSRTETELLDSAVSRIIAREYDKQLLDRMVINERAVLEFAQAMAAEDMQGGFQGLSIDTAREWAELTITPDIPGADSNLRALLQLALFSLGGSGQIRFSQELLEHYLLGRWYSQLFDNNPDAFVQYLAVRQIPHDSVTLRVIREHIGVAHVDQLESLALQAQSLPVSFKNVVQIASQHEPARAKLRRFPFERKDLSGILFESVDLRGASFVGADLSDTEFRSCDLTDANLTEAIFRNTKFANSEKLRGVQVGDLSRFYSINVPKGLTITTPSEARQWLIKASGRPVKVVEPCPPAMQLRHMFGKFVTPSGMARRSWLDKRGFLNGRRYHDPQEVLSAALRTGYLREEKDRDRIYRPDGDAYSELVGYASNFTLTPGLRALLSQSCDAEGCPHIPMAS
ncbi:MAG: pentapeptide repeat-containing protein [Dehalococcoidia bacterium]